MQRRQSQPLLLSSLSGASPRPQTGLDRSKPDRSGETALQSPVENTSWTAHESEFEPERDGPCVTTRTELGPSPDHQTDY